MNELPKEFGRSVLHDQANEIHQENDTGDGNYHFHIRGSEDDMRLQLNVAKVTDWYPSYNIAPTNSALIIYMTESGTQFNAKYILEPLKFGIVPSWAKPSDSTPVGKGTDKEGSKYSRELGRMQAKYFNCRRESLKQAKSLWNSCKNNRCVVPIQGYFEWMKTKTGKIPYFVHSTTAPLCFLAGFYSHNYNYTENQNVSGEYLSTFTIITVPAVKEDANDMSWLHTRKPMLIAPGTKVWYDWLDPKIHWNDKFVETVLNSTLNQAYTDIEAYQVTKEVGNSSNDGENMIQKINVKKQSSLSYFLSAQKGQNKPKSTSRSNPVKSETEVKQEFKKEGDSKKRVKSQLLNSQKKRKTVTGELFEVKKEV